MVDVKPVTVPVVVYRDGKRIVVGTAEATFDAHGDIVTNVALFDPIPEEAKAIFQDASASFSIGSIDKDN